MDTPAFPIRRITTFAVVSLLAFLLCSFGAASYGLSYHYPPRAVSSTGQDDGVNLQSMQSDQSGTVSAGQHQNSGITSGAQANNSSQTNGNTGSVTENGGATRYR